MSRQITIPTAITANLSALLSMVMADLAGELFNMMAGVKLINVPYRTNFMQDLVGGQGPSLFSRGSDRRGLHHGR